MAMRRISPEAGKALEILGHAVDYLTDEFVHEHRDLIKDKGRVDAIQRLMLLNRQIYYSCPENSSFSQRFGGMVQRIFHPSHHPAGMEH